MSSFTSPLLVTPMPDGRYWKLTRSFTYRIGSRYSQRIVRVPAGFLTDFASIPWWLWRFFFFWLPLWAKYHKAAPLHDWLYQHKQVMGKLITRKEADAIFLEAMLVTWHDHRSRSIIAHTEYYAVRVFGWFAWRGLTS